MKTQRHRDETTVIGSLPSVTAGELVANGWWVRSKEHGLQFKASTMKTVPPTTAEGIERNLGSGLVKGIGPILAKKLVGRSELAAFMGWRHFPTDVMCFAHLPFPLAEV